jgi:hypothetical protein
LVFHFIYQISNNFPTDLSLCKTETFKMNFLNYIKIYNFIHVPYSALLRHCNIYYFR